MRIRLEFGEPQSPKQVHAELEARLPSCDVVPGDPVARYVASQEAIANSACDNPTGRNAFIQSARRKHHLGPGVELRTMLGAHSWTLVVTNAWVSASAEDPVPTESAAEIEQILRSLNLGQTSRFPE